MKAMLSIKPEYVEKILSGEKCYEFRRRVFKRTDIDTIVIYSTSPQQRVVAEVEVVGILESDPEDIWNKTHDKAGISHKKFMAYFDGTDVAYAIELGLVNRYPHPRALSSYAEVSAPPQSFVYVRQ